MPRPSPAREKMHSEPPTTSDSIDISPALTVDRSGSVPVLRWTEVFGAEAYDIQFIDLNGGNAVPINVSVTADHWVLPAIAENGLYRIWIRGTRASGAAGPWNSDPYDFTLGDLPVIHSVRGLTPGSQPAFDWASPVGTTSTEIWVNDLDSKQRIAYSVVTGARSRFILPGLDVKQIQLVVQTDP